MTQRIKILSGPNLETMKSIPDASVQCIITSPPYWQLRSYLKTDHPLKKFEIGQEPTPEEFIANLVAVFRECKRILRDDGVMFVNMGDSYARTQNDNVPQTKNPDCDYPEISKLGSSDGAVGRGDRPGSRAAAAGLKPKDLVGIPWALAKALRDPYYAGSIKSERDRVWLAAVIDSEGCISGFTHDRSDGTGRRTGINITITNTSEALLAECHRIWPASQSQHENHGDGHLGGKPSWRWVCHGTENRTMLLREIYPYLIAKRTQAMLGYNLLRFMADAKRMGKTPEAPDIHNKRELLAKLISNSNQGNGSVIVPDWCVEPPSVLESGWYLRSDLIWAKGISCCDTYAGSCMPESVTDRPTKSHEYVFLFSKSQNYFYDQEAVKEQGTFPAGTLAAKGSEKRLNGDGVNARPAEYAVYSGMRNLRSVLAINPEPSGYEHFATMPTRLVKLCLQAGMSVKGCCPHCGAPWERVVESEKVSDGTGRGVSGRADNRVNDGGNSGLSGEERNAKKTTGWQPTCECGYGDLKRCVAFDPFGGTGTTAECAVELGHDAIMCELNPEYVSIAEERTNKTPGFTLA